MDYLAQFAMERPLAAGRYRVVVSYGGGRLDPHDFVSLGEAKAYADDVVSEWSDEPQLAYVFDSNFTLVYRGKAYYSP